MTRRDATPRTFLGIDPGQNGAAVLVAEDGKTVLGIQLWSPPRKPRFATTDELVAWKRLCQRVPRIVLNLDACAQIALEAQHVGDGNQSSLTLARWAERLAVSLPSTIPLVRPLATSWRAKVFPRGGGRLQRDPAKRMAVAAATPFLQAFDPDVRVTEDLAEAWCMARYAAFCPIEVPTT